MPFYSQLVSSSFTDDKKAHAYLAHNLWVLSSSFVSCSQTTKNSAPDYFSITDDIVGLYKPYGIPMFGHSRDCHHSIDKYLPALCQALNTDNLLQVGLGMEY
jgi:hypothetical protein